MALEYGRLTMERVNHDCFKIRGSKVVYTDPYEIPSGLERADLILVSHEHFDHCSPADITKLIKGDTALIAPGIAESKVRNLGAKEVWIVKPGDEVEARGITIRAIPAYNTNKFREPGVVFHPKDEERVGYLINLDGVTLYHAGDSDKIPEMAELGEVKIAFLPVSGTYVMTWQEAVEAAKLIKPAIAIPMHWGAIVGSKEDAEHFKKGLQDSVRVEII